MILAQIPDYVSFIAVGAAVISGPVGFFLSSWTTRGERAKGTEVAIKHLEGAVAALQHIPVAFAKMEGEFTGHTKLLDDVREGLQTTQKLVISKHESVNEQLRYLRERDRHRSRNDAQRKQLKDDPDVAIETWP